MRTPGLLMASLLAPALVAGQPAERSREDRNARTAPTSREKLASLELHLEHAVAAVSAPHAGILLGQANASRGYRLPGYGVVFVLTPRALPGGERAVHVIRGRLQGPRSRRDSHAGPSREVEVMTTTEVEEIEALERQVLVLQHAAAAQHRAAEEDHERIVRDIRFRFRLAPSTVEEGEIIGEDTHAVFADETAPLSVEPPSTRPPWSFWFGSETPGEARSPDRLVRDVQVAVIGVLESQAAGVTGLGADEFVTVAVDFVPGGFFSSHRRATRTLIVRARQGDLAACAQGKIALEELRARVEVIEY